MDNKKKTKGCNRSTFVFFLTGVLLFGAGPTFATPPTLYSKSAYQSPVRGEPDDLLLLPGYGFAADDTVVYQAIGNTVPALITPTSVPANSTATEGVAPIVSVANAPYSLTIRLPDMMQNDQSYALWVRNKNNEWSNGIKLNNARPLWITPDSVYATAQVANLPRYLKVVGRNLQPAPGAVTQVKLGGPAVFILNAANDGNDSTAIEHYVAKVDLPASMPVGDYLVWVSRDGGVSWVGVSSLYVADDPLPPAEFPITNYGCSRDDTGNTDHTACIVNAINDAARNGGGAVVFGPGIWYLSNSATLGVDPTYAVVVPTGVSLKGTGATLTTIVESASWNSVDASSSFGPRTLFTLLGGNTVQGIRFEDHHIYWPSNLENSMFSLGKKYSVTDTAPVTDVTFTQNIFDKPYYAISDGGLAIDRFFVTYNEFGAYRNALKHGGYRDPTPYIPDNQYHIDHSIIAYNTFKPGSHITDREGPIVSELGASRWLDVSNNIVDGASAEYLYQNLDKSVPPYNYDWDKKGWRAGFFWHLRNNHEMMLVSQNTATCTGDKIGDGEAIAYDNNQNTYAFAQAQTVRNATTTTVNVAGPLLNQQSSYYNEYWLQIAQGRGVGQVRRIVSYVINPDSSVTFTVSPAWDVIPDTTSRITIAHQFWQAYTVDNFVDHRSTGDNGPCQNTKSVNWPGLGSVVGGGLIGTTGQTADSTIEGNQQFGTDGIRLSHQYGGWTIFQSFVELRGNTINGEYKWDSNCSWSGIGATYSMPPTAPAPVPIAGYGMSIARNTISHADGLRGGAIWLSRSGNDGPAPYNWKFVNNTLIYHNALINPSPAANNDGCDNSNIPRIGINLWDYPHIDDSNKPEYANPSRPEYYTYRPKVWRTVLYANSCDNGQVPVPLNDSGLNTPLNFKATSTVRVCPSGMDSGSCECSDVQPVDVALTATASPTKVAVGDTVTYIVQVTNTGPSSATAVLLAMEPGQGVNITGYSITPSSQGTCDPVSYSCQLNTLAGGATATVMITGTATALGVSTSAYSATLKEADSNATNNGASVAVSVVEKADLGVSITDSPDPAQLSDNVTYTITVTSNGPATATGVTVTDNLGGATLVSTSGGTCTGAGPVTCAVSNIANGTNATLTIVVKPVTAGTLTNNVSVTENEIDPVTTNNTASTDTAVLSADLSVSVAGSPVSVLVGGQVTYTITVNNHGPSPASNVRVNDIIPASMTVLSATGSQGTCSTSSNVNCNLGNLANGAQATVTIVVRTSSTGSFANLVSVAGNEYDPNTGDNDTAVMTTVNPAADLSVTQTDTPDPVFAGQALSYTVTVTNSGPSAATGVMMTDTLPSGLTLGSVNASQGSCTGSSIVTCSLGNLSQAGTATVSLTVTPYTTGVITSSASVSGTESDPNAANNTASVSTTVDPAADLSITLTDSPDPVLLGQTVTYTTTVTNNGPSVASNATATGTLATCNLGTLASGASRSCTATVTPGSVGTFSQSMNAGAAEYDPNGNNNGATTTTTVIAPDLLPTALSSSKSGTKVTLSDTVKNQGNGNAGTFTVAYYLSTNTTYEPGTDIPLASSSGGSGVCTRTVTSLSAGLTSSVSNKTCYKPTGAVTGTRYYVLVVDDSTNQVIESNEGNNVRATSGQVWW